MKGMKGKQYINECTRPAPLELLLNSLVVIIMMNEQAYITFRDEIFLHTEFVITIATKIYKSA